MTASENSRGNLPLAGIRVLDLTRVVAAPLGTQILADFGAEIIKVERPVSGDDSRSWSAASVTSPDGRDSISGYFLAVNRGKKSITVDMGSKEGQGIIRDLIRKSDVLIENYAVGNLQKFHLDYASVKDLNPSLIYCSVTGFGQDGPYAKMLAYDILIQGLCGLMSVNGEPDGAPGAGPQRVPIPIADVMTSPYVSNAILAALLKRQSSGLGEYIDISMLDVMLASSTNYNVNYLVSRKLPQRTGIDNPTIYPYRPFPCRDGQVILAIVTDSQWRKFCEAVDKVELADDARFSTNNMRSKNRAELYPLIVEILKDRTGQEWMEFLTPKGVPCGPINNFEQALHNAHIAHRGLVFESDHPTYGKAPLLNTPIKFSGSFSPASLPPPLLGQDTDEILTKLLDYSAETVQALRDKAAI